LVMPPLREMWPPATILVGLVLPFRKIVPPLVTTVPTPFAIAVKEARGVVDPMAEANEILPFAVIAVRLTVEPPATSLICPNAMLLLLVVLVVLATNELPKTKVP